MSTFRACSIAGRVVLIHDMPDQTIISELEGEDAGLLIRQLQDALNEGCRPPPRIAKAC